MIPFLASLLIVFGLAIFVLVSRMIRGEDE